MWIQTFVNFSVTSDMIASGLWVAQCRSPYKLIAFCSRSSAWLKEDSILSKIFLQASLHSILWNVWITSSLNNLILKTVFSYIGENVENNVDDNNVVVKLSVKSVANIEVAYFDSDFLEMRSFLTSASWPIKLWLIKLKYDLRNLKNTAVVCWIKHSQLDWKLETVPSFLHSMYN